MDKQGTNIFEGEAIESDGEEDYYGGFVQNTMVTNDTKRELKIGELPSSSVVVSGEASESDEDIGDYLRKNDYPNVPSKLIQDEDCSISIEPRRPRFESPFHKKLWERNFAFRLGVVQSQLDRYDQVTTKLKTFIPIVNRTQRHAQEALKNYRSVSEASKLLNDNLESVLQQIELPKLNAPVSLD